jgi:peptidoglycan hydrolase CwlO-like protein
MQKHHHYFLLAFCCMGLGFIAHRLYYDDVTWEALSAFVGDSTYQQKLQELETRKEQLESKITQLQTTISDKKAQGEAKIQEVQKLLEETQKNYQETKEAISQLHTSVQKWGELLEKEDTETDAPAP